MKVYKAEYKAPELLLLPLGNEDILTSSPASERGVDTPFLDEEGTWLSGS